MKLALLVLLIFLVIIFIIPIYFKVEFKKKNHDDIINVRIILLKGLIDLKYEISYLDLITKYKEPSLMIKGKLEDKNTGRDLKRKQDILKLEEIRNIYYKVKKYKDTFTEIFKYIIKKIDFSSLRWSSKIGLGDAALTGITNGLVWIIIGTLLNIILNHKDIKEMSINIYPDFNENILEIDFFCIIKLKIVHIIIAGFKGIKVFIKGGVLNA